MTLTATRPQMFIDGDRTDAASGETMAVINPATEEEIAQVPKGDASDVDRAVAAARAAFESWSQSTPQDRSKALFAFADAIEGDAETLSSLEQANVGKPKGTADFDVEFTVDNVRFFAGAARVVEGKAAAARPGWSRARRRASTSALTPRCSAARPPAWSARSLRGTTR